MEEKRNNTPPANPIQINLKEILRSRVPDGKQWLIPAPIVATLEKLICQEQLNFLLREAFPARGSEFAARIIDLLDIHTDVIGMENLQPGKRYIFASNHPLGGLDGITLIALLGKHYGDENVWFLVNDLLMNVEPLSPVFLPINKYGSQGRAAAKAISEAYASDAQIIIFPAGLVSRIGKEGIRDLKWQKAFVAKALESDRDIIPVHFEALNRMRFYRTAKWRKKLGLKVNIEQILLPSELCAARGKQFRITFGAPIPVEQLRASGKRPDQLAAEIRSRIYSL